MGRAQLTGPNGTGPNGYSGGPKWDGPNRNGTMNKQCDGFFEILGFETPMMAGSWVLLGYSTLVEIPFYRKSQKKNCIK